jgi:glycosyltransferase involved in cell wall biosynthesis
LRGLRVAVLCGNHSLGDERAVARQAASLARMGCSVTVFGRPDPRKQAPEVPGLGYQPLLPFIRGASFRSRISRIAALRQLARIVRTFPADVFTAHEPDSALIAIVGAHKRGIPVHFDQHEYFEGMLADRAPRALSGTALAVGTRLMKFIIRRADRITTVSPAIAEKDQSYAPRRAVELLYNSPPLDYFPVCDQAAAYPLSICHTGWLDHSRGLKQILQAVAKASRSAPIRLVIIGDVHASCKADFNRMIGELGLQETVAVTGWIPYDAVGSVIAGCQVGLVTLQATRNNFASISNKLFDYLGCGQPAIVPRGSASEALIRKYECGIAVDTGDPEEIAGAILTLARDQRLRQDLGRNARFAMEHHLGWHKMEEVLARVYEDLRQIRNQDLNRKAQ